MYISIHSTHITTLYYYNLLYNLSILNTFYNILEITEKRDTSGLGQIG